MGKKPGTKKKGIEDGGGWREEPPPTSECGSEVVPLRPAVGMESEFNVYIDEAEIVPQDYWGHPRAFIDGPMLRRVNTSSQVPSGGAVYFDRGVIEVVTPLIELAPACTARVVRSVWEQIGFVREQLDRWEIRTGHRVRLRAYSAHYNVSFELPKEACDRKRNIRRLARLLGFLLPVPVAILGTNRRSTGVGVRPRGNRIEVTVDFTPDPAMMVATASLVVGIVREILSWPDYSLSLLDRLPLPTVLGVVPGPHTTRRGWLAKDFHFPWSPFDCDLDAEVWPVRDGRVLSLRQVAYETAFFFRRSIRRFSDPFSFRLVFAVLSGKVPSLLELPDRPLAYEDVGRRCRWGMRVPWEEDEPLRRSWGGGSLEDHRAARGAERAAFEAERGAHPAAAGRSGPPLPRIRTGRGRVRAPFVPERPLSRSDYEQVFLRLVSGRRLRMEGEAWEPVAMDGWYVAVFEARGSGRKVRLSIDELVDRAGDWAA